MSFFLGIDWKKARVGIGPFSPQLRDKNAHFSNGINLNPLNRTILFLTVLVSAAKRLNPKVGDCSVSHERRNISGKMTRANVPEDLFPAGVRAEGLHFPAQDHSPPERRADPLCISVHLAAGCAVSRAVPARPVADHPAWGARHALRVPIIMFVLIQFHRKKSQSHRPLSLHLASFLSVSTQQF